MTLGALYAVLQNMSYIGLPNSESHISNQVIAAKLHTVVNCNAEFIFVAIKFVYINVRKFMKRPPYFY